MLRGGKDRPPLQQLVPARHAGGQVAGPDAAFLFQLTRLAVDRLHPPDRVAGPGNTAACSARPGRSAPKSTYSSTTVMPAAIRLVRPGPMPAFISTVPRGGPSSPRNRASGRRLLLIPVQPAASATASLVMGLGYERVVWIGRSN